MDFLNGIDSKISALDVIDDFDSEKAQVLKAQGENFQYTFGLHVVRLLLSSIIPELDNMDTQKIKIDQHGNIVYDSEKINKNGY